MRDRGRHIPPRLGRALNATEVQGSRKNLNLVYKQVNENTFLSQTLRPIRRRDKYAQQTGGAMPGRLPLGDRGRAMWGFSDGLVSGSGSEEAGQRTLPPTDSPAHRMFPLYATNVRCRHDQRSFMIDRRYSIC